MHDFEDNDVHYAERPNKSQLKRENAALEDLCEELIALPPERLNALELPADLLDALLLAQSIASHHGAAKRQRKFIAKLLREGDAAGEVRAKLAEAKTQSAQAIHRQHLIERWRDRLLGSDDHEVNAFMEEHPGADRQKLRQLARDAHKERRFDASPRSARLLFKYLREVMSAAWEHGHEADAREE
jgi:ribosome-associated protein